MPQTLTRSAGISLRQLLTDAQFFGASDIHTASCSSDSKQVRPGDLYVALVGSDVDGHELAYEAISRGATAVLAERPLPVSVPVCIVDDTRVAYARLCQALVGNPSEHMRVIGVTGTSGKTTVSWLLAAILEAAGERVGLINSLGLSDSVDSIINEATNPTVPELARWMGRMHQNGCSHAVVEMSSRALAWRQTAGVSLDAAVVTNLRKAHLDLHGSVMNYRNAKTRIFRHLKSHGFSVLNLDDAGSKLALSKLKCPVMTTAIHERGEITANILEQHLAEQTFLLSAGSEIIPVCTRIIGDEHVQSCLLAAATGLVLGIDLRTIVRGIESIDHIPGRMERVECGQNFGVFVDLANTPESLSSSLKTLRRVTRGRVICVYGADGDGPREERALLGRVVERNTSLGIISNINPRDQQPLEIAHDILDGYENPAKGHVLPDRAKAIEWALSQARQGDCVLLAGRGIAQEIQLSKRNIACEDKAVAQRWLYGSAARHEAA